MHCCVSGAERIAAAEVRETLLLNCQMVSPPVEEKLFRA